MTEYAVQHWSGKEWRIHRLDGHHGAYLGFYEVTLRGNYWRCSCPAPLYCKHIEMIGQEKPAMNDTTPGRGTEDMRPKELSKSEMRAIAEAACKSAPITVIPKGVSHHLTGREWQDVAQSPARVDLEQEALKKQLAVLEQELEIIRRAAKAAR